MINKESWGRFEDYYHIYPGYEMREAGYDPPECEELISIHGNDEVCDGLNREFRLIDRYLLLERYTSINNLQYSKSRPHLSTKKRSGKFLYGLGDISLS